ncbi:MAG: F0F1 ATP synthase subunit A [Lachnospiraceae bacterium]|nr:F0F1 ATP synthase subunit A [Lachnospiraceae bacterium]
MSISPSGPGVLFIIPIFGGLKVTETALSLFIVLLILCTAGILLGRNLKKRPGKMQVIVEKGVSVLEDLVKSSMGEHNAHWTPFIGTIFLSSIVGSFLGMTGFLRSTTADVSVTLTWALTVSVLIWYHSIKTNGFLNWLKGFTEPIAVMTPMNIISEIAQPVSMAFRHFGNIAGGGVISSVFYAGLSLASGAILRLIASSGAVAGAVLMAAGIIGFIIVSKKKPKLLLKILCVVSFVIGLFGLLQGTGILSGVPILQVGLPAVLSLYFDVFSGLIQAFVFSLLTMIYISGACPPPEETEKAAS